MSLEPGKECLRQCTRREENVCLILCCKTETGLDPNPTHLHVSTLLLLCIVNLFKHRQASHYLFTVRQRCPTPFLCAALYVCTERGWYKGHKGLYQSSKIYQGNS